MKKSNPKYSIIIPTFNGINYLPTCIKTITDQVYDDFELIISDDHSTDGTKEFLQTLKNDRISIIEPAESLSMTEHWEWALSHAKGEWCIFVGQDDGLQPYFFHLSDKLTAEASKKGLRTIASSRAYFFWKGCEYIYGDIAVSYMALKKTKIHNSKFEALKALLGFQTYFELPQMYTTSLFHKGLLNEARLKQNGCVFTCHPQDANLAAIACSLESKYLKSYIPLGWVGSSPKSAGMAIDRNTKAANKDDQADIELLRKVYLEKIASSKLQYNELAGLFSLNSAALYFWQALLMTRTLRSSRINDFIVSRGFRILLFACVLDDIKNKNERGDVKATRLKEFESLLCLNRCSVSTIRFWCQVRRLTRLLYWPLSLMCRLMTKTYRTIVHASIRYDSRWGKNIGIGMQDASVHIANMIKTRGWLQN